MLYKKKIQASSNFEFSFIHSHTDILKYSHLNSQITFLSFYISHAVIKPTCTYKRQCKCKKNNVTSKIDAVCGIRGI